MNTFADYLENIFEPLFDATRDPQAYLDIHLFLQQVIPLASRLQSVFSVFLPPAEHLTSQIRFRFALSTQSMTSHLLKLKSGATRLRQTIGQKRTICHTLITSTICGQISQR